MRYFQLPVKMTMQGNMCLSSAGISSPSKWAAKGGVNSASCLMLTVHSLPLWGICTEGHFEVSFLAPACFAGLSDSPPAIWTAAMRWGEFWAGLQLYFALFSLPRESFSLPSHFTPWPWLLSLPQPSALPDLNSWQPLWFPAGQPSKFESSHLCVLLFLFWTAGMSILFLSTAMSF